MGKHSTSFFWPFSGKKKEQSECEKKLAQAQKEVGGEIENEIYLRRGGAEGGREKIIE
jgi:hypothetical protein